MRLRPVCTWRRPIGLGPIGLEFYERRRPELTTLYTAFGASIGASGLWHRASHDIVYFAGLSYGFR